MKKIKYEKPEIMEIGNLSEWILGSSCQSSGSEPGGSDCKSSGGTPGGSTCNPSGGTPS